MASDFSSEPKIREIALPKRSKPSKLAEILGAEEALGSILFVLFIPSKTRLGEALPAGEDQSMWANAAGDVLAELFNGATEMPPAKGKWRNDEDDIITEDVTLVHSYATPEASEDEAKLRKLAKFLHRMGKNTDPGEIGIVIDNVFHKIRKFPLANVESPK